MAALQNLKDRLAKNTFGITKKEAQTKEICVGCKEPAIPKCYSEAGIREYRISGLCEKCFDKITQPTLFTR